MFAILQYKNNPKEYNVTAHGVPFTTDENYLILDFATKKPFKTKKAAKEYVKKHLKKDEHYFLIETIFIPEKI